jgi:hypothetical protein
MKYNTQIADLLGLEKKIKEAEAVIKNLTKDATALLAGTLGADPSVL